MTPTGMRPTWNTEIDRLARVNAREHYELRGKKIPVSLKADGYSPSSWDPWECEPPVTPRAHKARSTQEPQPKEWALLVWNPDKNALPKTHSRAAIFDSGNHNQSSVVDFVNAGIQKFPGRNYALVVPTDKQGIIAEAPQLRKLKALDLLVLGEENAAQRPEIQALRKTAHYLVAGGPGTAIAALKACDQALVGNNTESPMELADHIVQQTDLSKAVAAIDLRPKINDEWFFSRNSELEGDLRVEVRSAQWPAAAADWELALT